MGSSSTPSTTIGAVVGVTGALLTVRSGADRSCGSAMDGDTSEAHSAMAVAVANWGWRLMQRASRCHLSQDRFLHHPGHVREAEVAALIFERQLRMVDAQTAQDGRMQIVHMHRVPYDVVAVIIRFSVRHSRLHASACQPHGEAARMMIAPVIIIRAASQCGWQAEA